MKLGDIIFQLVLRFGVLSTVVHEYGHLLSLKIMGYKGEIRSTVLNAVYPIEYNLMSNRELMMFYLSGGVFQALIFSLLCIHDKDEEDQLVNKMIAIQGFIYALFEGVLSREWWDIGSVIALMMSFIFMAYILSKSKVDP